MINKNHWTNCVIWQMNNGIDYNSYEMMESIIFIIGALGLRQSFQHICDNKGKIKNTDIIKLVEEAIEEFGDTVNDPYSGLR